MRICQLIVEEVGGKPSADMEGVFQDQTSVAGGGKRAAAPKRTAKAQRR